MSNRKFAAASTATLLAAAAFAGLSAGTASATTRTMTPAIHYIVTVTGHGATLADAEDDAQSQIAENPDCGPGHLFGDGRSSDGTWWATMKAGCNTLP